MDAIEKLTGVRAAYGGSHPGIGTHNALLSLGEDVYLEIIAADPAQPKPSRPRPFELDDESTHGRIRAFAVHPNVAVPGATIELLAATMLTAVQPRAKVSHGGSSAGSLHQSFDGTIHQMSRRKPDGKMMRWRLTSLKAAAGPRPWLIDWGAFTSPAKAAPKGCSLVGLQCYGQAAARMETLLLTAMGLQPLIASGKAVEFAESEHNFLIAQLDTPKGRVAIGERFEL